MWSAVTPTSITIPRPEHRNLSSNRALISTAQFCSISFPTITMNSPSNLNLTIRMGGGPRTFPGGVSKWQWKRMQAKKAKQLLKARLCRERQIYEMRKRAELKEAVSELERPWEVVERAPTLFSIKADEQVKVLADRFQKPGGFDMWSEKDGPQVFRASDGLPSARFFPKGVVHSVKPYGVVAGGSDSSDDEGEKMDFDDWIGRDRTGRSGLNQQSGRHLAQRRNVGGLNGEANDGLKGSGKKEIPQLKIGNSRAAGVSYPRNGYTAKVSQRRVVNDGLLEDKHSSTSNWSKWSNSKISTAIDEHEGTWRSKDNARHVFHQRWVGNKVASYGSSRSHGNRQRQGSGSQHVIDSGEKTNYTGKEKLLEVEAIEPLPASFHGKREMEKTVCL